MSSCITIATRNGPVSSTAYPPVTRGAIAMASPTPSIALMRAGIPA